MKLYFGACEKKGVPALCLARVGDGDQLGDGRPREIGRRRLLALLAGGISAAVIEEQLGWWSRMRTWFTNGLGELQVADGALALVTSLLDRTMTCFPSSASACHDFLASERGPAMRTKAEVLGLLESTGAKRPCALCAI